MGYKIEPKPSKPIYKHDCEECVFLGIYEKSEGEFNNEFYDIYWCPLDKESYILVRYGNKEHECFSGKIPKIFISSLNEIKEIAVKKKGLKVKKTE